MNDKDGFFLREWMTDALARRRKEMANGRVAMVDDMVWESLRLIRESKPEDRGKPATSKSPWRCV